MSAPTITPARLDLDAARRWLATMHGSSSGVAWIGSQHDRFKGRCFDLAAPGWTIAASRYIHQLDQTGTPGIYLRTTTLHQPPRTGRGGDDDSLSLPGLAADLDLAGPGHKTTKPLPPDPAAARAIIDESGLPDPSIWIHSGGGLYAWWLLDQPLHIGPDNLAKVKTLSARWQDPIAHAAETLGYSHGRLGDLARILRIPGTVNRKPGMPEPRPCHILEDSGRRYSYANLRAVLIDALAAVPAPEPLRLPTRTTFDAGAGVKAWHDFEARTDWAEILEPHGWSLNHVRGDVRYWTRPGKDRRTGFSASTGRDPARDRLYVFTDATPFDPNRPYVKYHAYAVLEHGGDVPAACRELVRLGYGTPSERQVAA